MTAVDDLPGRVHDLLSDAIGVYHDNPSAQAWLYRQAERFAGPLRLAVAGPPGAGKSTLVNALVGQGVALRTDAAADVPDDRDAIADHRRLAPELTRAHRRHGHTVDEAREAPAVDGHDETGRRVRVGGPLARARP